MLYLRLPAELHPHARRLIPCRSDVIWNIRLFVAIAILPAVLVLLPNPMAVWIVMVRSKIEGIDAAQGTMDQSVRQRPSQGIVASDDEQRVARIRFNMGSELLGWGMILVIRPNQVLANCLDTSSKIASTSCWLTFMD